ncbi:FUSC family protein [Ideonella sp. B7]|uniref:FUSC family protein n=1 Tax=Ideonella benzenivorans TaxID=2831643 RepID=UPI001CECC0D3|nr:FUSC family protein [Ideonella benzenivorans]MCA6215152.1 FUSC family protein [Ideonella benzenivorans]
MTWPTRSEWLYSLKCYAAAMLALYVALKAGLPRPFWSMMTAYVVANPLAGAVRSKAVYRFGGTFLGAAASVLLVPNLANAPLLLTLALALWVGGCLYISLQDRTPRSYVFMLAGYTAALVSFPSVDQPEQLFDNALARVEEIGIGILCATLVHSLVMPTSLSTPLLGLLERSQGHARTWLADLAARAHRADAEGATLAADRQRLAADITQLRILSTHVPFDTGHLRWTEGALQEMQDRLAGLTPALSAAEDRLQALEEAEGRLAPDVVAVLDALGDWLKLPPPDQAAALPWLQGQLDSLGQDPVLPDWSRALRISLATRLGELLLGWQACGALRAEIDTGLTGAGPVPARRPTVGTRVLHRDPGLALLSAAAAVVAISFCSLVWIQTAWPLGSVAAMMAAIFCSFFAVMDNPVPAISGALKATAWSMPIAALYVLVLLPLAHDFGSLVLFCSPAFLLLGCLAARPATAGLAFPMIMGVAGSLALGDIATLDFPYFFNSNLSLLMGIAVAALVNQLMRTVGSDVVARRLRRAVWRELAAQAGARHGVPDEGRTVRSLDRIGLLAPRIAQTAPQQRDDAARAALRELRVGADIAVLQAQRAAGGAPGARPLLVGIARGFRQWSRHGPSAWPDALRRALDRALLRALKPSAEPQPALVTALVGLRRNLFPQAPLTLGAVTEEPAA